MDTPAPQPKVFESDLTTEPPPVPRVVTPAINRRIWLEPSVRVWWLATLLLALIAFAFVADRLYARSVQKQLITQGIHTDGKIIAYELKTAPGQLVDANRGMSMEYTDQSGRKISGVGVLSQINYIGKIVSIRYDPAHPEVWTDLTEPPGWGDTLFGGVFILPVVAGFAAFAWWQAHRMRHTWQQSDAMVAVVNDRKQTPVAPMSWAVRCSLRDGTDRRLFTVHIPRVGGLLEKGDEFWVLVPNRGKRVAAAWFF